MPQSPRLVVEWLTSSYATSQGLSCPSSVQMVSWYFLFFLCEKFLYTGLFTYMCKLKKNSNGTAMEKFSNFNNGCRLHKKEKSQYQVTIWGTVWWCSRSSRFTVEQGDLWNVSTPGKKRFPLAFLELMTAGKHILSTYRHYFCLPVIFGTLL